MTGASPSNPALGGKNYQLLSSPLRDCVVIVGMAKSVMLNLFQHLMELNTYETLKRVQGDKK